MRIAASSLCCALVLFFCATVIALPIASVSGEDSELFTRAKKESKEMRTLQKKLESFYKLCDSDLKKSIAAATASSNEEKEAIDTAFLAQNDASVSAGRALAEGHSKLSKKAKALMKALADCHGDVSKEIASKALAWQRSGSRKQPQLSQEEYQAQFDKSISRTTFYNQVKQHGRTAEAEYNKWHSS